MGNTMVVWGKNRRCSKIMKVDGTTFMLRQPATASDALLNHPDHVLMESEDVKRLGIKAKALHPDHPLKPKKLYFLVQLPKLAVQPPTASYTRRVQSGIHMTAKDRLESLMLARRSQSDITIIRSTTTATVDESGEGMRVKMRLPKSEVARLVKESGGDASVAAAKIMELSVSRRKAVINGEDRWNGEEKRSPVKREKRMRFAPVETTPGDHQVE